MFSKDVRWDKKKLSLENKSEHFQFEKILLARRIISLQGNPKQQQIN